MQQFWAIMDILSPDRIMFILIAIVFLFGVFKCVAPSLSSAGMLRRAKSLLIEGAKAKLARPVWLDPDFLGKKLQQDWSAFLQSMEIARASGTTSDVAEFIHEENAIMVPGRAGLAEMLPGLCTSLGILGTFLGLSLGLTGLDVMEIGSYARLTDGIGLAFNTSIFGITSSLCFNVLNRYAFGRANAALEAFIAAFYKHAAPQPPDAQTQLLAYQREQANAFSQFAENMSAHMAAEINRAIVDAMSPVQQTMDRFMNAATRAQIDGLDYIIARFIDRMNSALEGQLRRLGEAIAQTADNQLRTQDEMRNTVATVGDLTQSVVQVQAISEQVIQKFAVYVTDMENAYKQVGAAQSETAELLDEINQASLRQSRYLSALQEYQAKLQSSFQDYTVWTDNFVGGLEGRTQAQNESLEQIGMEMRTSSELLRGAYKTFVESIEVGLANALGLFDENMQNLTRQIHGTLSDIQETMISLERAMTRTANAVTSEREVS